jgi:hypothetical protein
MVNTVCSENYQDLHGAEVDIAIPDVRGDIAGDLLGVGTSCSDEVLNTNPILKIK